MRTPIIERKIEKPYGNGIVVSDFPDLFYDELSMDDYIAVSHTETKTSHKIKISELMMFIKRNVN